MFFNEKTANRYAAKVTQKPTAIELEPSLMIIAEQQARASHEGWLRGKIAQGYIYGPVTNDDPEKGPLTNPLIVPYDELDEDTKASNIANAVSVIKILRNKEVSFVNFTKVILYPLAKEIHDEWSREKIKNGWKWGPVTDKLNKVHRDLVPFEVLATTPELQDDIAYDVDTAREIIVKMISDNDVFPVITSLANFTLEATPA